MISDWMDILRLGLIFDDHR